MGQKRSRRTALNKSRNFRRLAALSKAEEEQEDSPEQDQEL